MITNHMTRDGKLKYAQSKSNMVSENSVRSFGRVANCILSTSICVARPNTAGDSLITRRIQLDTLARRPLIQFFRNLSLISFIFFLSSVFWYSNRMHRIYTPLPSQSKAIVYLAPPLLCSTYNRNPFQGLPRPIMLLINISTNRHRKSYPVKAERPSMV